ncbi:cyanophycinase [Alteromonas oceanisediminis]|uniref:cyanophycinase n=1 Tax=Alteromonas oceanisediminis TaxID=2836180 RepID=UPI001BDA8BF2|nr:cyanophycinase [Alteromonas oceanisediminis]MBT0585635.1 cyanophycinase [Alteromonas oceanisediminis]
MMYLNRSSARISRSIFFTLVWFLSVTFCVLKVSAQPIPGHIERYDMMLAGGSLKTCSSLSLKNCQQNDFNDNDLNGLLYEISPDAAARLTQALSSESQHSAQVAQLNAVLATAYAAQDNGSTREIATLSQQQFFAELSDAGLDSDQVRALPDTLYFALLDTHEVKQHGEGGLRKQERANVNWNTSLAAQSVYRQFVDQAKLRTKNGALPRIAIVTASSRDPFESADFYLSAFSSLGADVVWLPLDATFQQARFLEQAGAKGCSRLAALRQRSDSFDRERIYPLRTALQQQYCRQPALLHDILSNVEGVFFNGGDQSRTLAALLTPSGQASESLQIIHRRMLAQELIVGGTSAGTAVQSGGFHANRPVPMISSGDSQGAMQRGAFAQQAPSIRSECTDCNDRLLPGDLTYRAQGGSGLFSLGVVDTHFSERDREARLAVLIAETGLQFGFGVDETTALMVGFDADKTRLRVVGENGVFMLDRASGQYGEAHTADFRLSQRQLSGLSHYLASGSTAQRDLASGEWRFSLAGEKADSRKKLRLLDDGEWRNQTRTWCGSSKQLTWQQTGYEVITQASEATQFFVSSAYDRRHCSYIGLPFVLISTGS